MSLQELTSPDAIRMAIREFDAIGRTAFLDKYGFRRSRHYLLHDKATGRFYDSKAIVGAAYGYQFPKKGPLTASEFSGGENTVEGKLSALGFEVVKVGPDWPEGEDFIEDSSWTVQGHSLATKIMDKSTFTQGTGIPVKVRPFFLDEEIRPREHRPVTLVFEEREFDAYITLESSPLARTRLFWPGDFLRMLGEQFPAHSQKCRAGGDIKDDKKIAMHLERIDGYKRFLVSFETIFIINPYDTGAGHSSVKEGEWSDSELEAAVKAYLWMLEQETSGNAYSKAEVNRSLREGPLSTRTKASVEYRMQNISAVLQELCLPWIKGYLPAKNLGTGVKDRIRSVLANLGAYSMEDYAPSADPAILEDKVRKLRKHGLTGIPRGEQKPQPSTTTSTTYARDPLVKAWVLENAKGNCEGCDAPAPFQTRYGEPFLEVHHVRTLADGGSDTTYNAIALCPNCHRRCHASNDQKHFTENLFSRVSRLVRESKSGKG